MRQVKIAIMGMGTIGSGVYRVVEKEGDYIAHKEAIELSVKSVLSLAYSIPIPDEKKVASIEDIVNDPEIETVVEVMGGVEPAKTFITKCLRAGKNVVSANKELIAQHWAELEGEAKKTGAGFYFEASVGGGIPILRAVTDSLQANTITEVYGIINGTTNYILTKMSDEGLDYADVLKEAQALGYAEANPTADVEGYDAMYKLSILASMAFHVRLPIEHILREGISNITKADIAAAKELGMEIKLLAIGKREGEHVELRVHPTMIPKDHPLAGVKGSFNAIMVHGSAVDDVMFYGRGAGDLPTASAIVSDILYAARTKEHRYMTFMNEQKKLSPTLVFNTDWQTGCYIRLNVADKPGAMARIADIMGKNNVNLHSVLQKETDGKVASIVFMVKKAHEQSLQNAIKEIKALDDVIEVCNVIRVETFEK